MLATNTQTGKTSAESVAAVLVHHDTNRYDLTIKTDSGTAVIQTTRTHLFWDQDTKRWVKAGALKYGTHLRTSSGSTATVTAGGTPKAASGWMWDLTVTSDHDFYVQAADADALVHNCPIAGGAATDPATEAASWQGSGACPGVDAWSNVTLKAGTIVHAGEPGVSGFFASDAAAASVGSDAQALNEGLQIAPRAGFYRPGLTAFRLTQDVQAARSIALANSQFGAGGLEQFYIPSWADVTEPVVTRLMTNTVAR